MASRAPSAPAHHPLSRELIARAAGRNPIGLPTATQLELPERAIQFGTGAFLRGFVGSIVDDANRHGALGGRVVAVSSTASGRDDAINRQNGLYTLAVRGHEDGQTVSNVRVIAATSRALSAADDWDAVLACARDEKIDLVFSNTTEVGIVLDETDAATPGSRLSFPAKLTAFLLERGRAFGFDPARAPVVLPCELIDQNGDKLRDIVHTLARRWRVGAEFERWLEHVAFCNTLVDRIVTTNAGSAANGDGQVERLDHAAGFHDELLTCTEPYRLFAIQGDAALRARLPFASERGVLVEPDIVPYRTRKLRILNGAHTLSAPLGLLTACDTVASTVAHPLVGAFQKRVVFEEIVPSLSVPAAADFAHAVLERFANPFMRHALWDITLQGTLKMSIRVVPTILDHVRTIGRCPRAIAFGFAMHVLFMRGELQEDRRRSGKSVPGDAAAEPLRARWAQFAVAADRDVGALVRDVCANRALWGYDLTTVPGFVETVTEHLARAVSGGVSYALEKAIA